MVRAIGIKTKKEMYSLGILFIFVGLFIFGIITLIFINQETKKKTWDKTEAIIEDIKITRKRKKGKTHTDYDVTVSYYYDNKQYSKKIGYYHSGMDEGESIIIYVNPSKPSDMIADSGYFLILIGSIFLVSFTGMGTYMVIQTRKGNIVYENGSGE
jgi:hypothetical protein